MEYIKTVLTCFTVQIFSLVGVTVLFGFFTWGLNELFLKLLGNFGVKLHKYTGIIGTPIHELSHAFCCFIFGHKIVEMKMFSPSSEDGTLGYVNHSYNKKNLYQVAGNYFIGVAPLFGCSIAVIALMLVLIPGTFDASFEIIRSSFGRVFDIGASESYFDFFSSLHSVLKTFVAPTVNVWRYILFVILAVPIAMHARLSPADIKAGIGGMIIFILTILAECAVIGIISDSVLLKVSTFAQGLALCEASLMAIGIIFYCLILIVIAIVKFIAFMIKKATGH